MKINYIEQLRNIFDIKYRDCLYILLPHITFITTFVEKIEYNVLHLSFCIIWLIMPAI